MKNKDYVNIWIAFPLIFLTYTIIDIIENYGEIKPSYEVNYTHIITAIIVIGSCFYCGYKYAKTK